MTSSFQTIAALALVVLAAAWLVASALRRRKTPGCGGGCGALSPDARDLRQRLTRDR